jgi:NitT/TauT family transport system substrate-binding protein
LQYRHWTTPYAIDRLDNGISSIPASSGCYRVRKHRLAEIIRSIADLASGKDNRRIDSTGMGGAMPIVQSRRRLLTHLGVAGVAGLGGIHAAGLGGGARSLAAEPPPEITTIRFEKAPVTCLAPQYVAEELLRAEGFTDIRYQTSDKEAPAQAVAHHELDWDLDFTPAVIAEVDDGAAVTMVAGVHAGCFELFAHDQARSIADLRGRTVGWFSGYATPRHLVSLMAKFVGLDPDKDIHWVSDANPMDLFVDRKIDAFLATAPEAQELRDRKIGHSIVNSSTDRPWSQYFCCMLFGRTEFVQKYPIATKRVVRAILKAADLCANEPQRVARLMVERGFTPRYDYALQSLQELPYGVWRDYDPEDTVRFYALRLNEAGFIKSVPKRIIAEHTNWRFVNQLKRELKT